ncbi:MAG TPA: alpha/beta hydrolase fold domain-containing protein [Steroidobacteraceae bacterium]|nr:alpha/beta hydrolase fold domain-containing protein [Steroidobacteraceae bacterium]
MSADELDPRFYIAPLRERDSTLPAALCLLSPVTDLASNGDTNVTLASVDYLEAGIFDVARRAYAPGAQLGNPLVSPAYGDFTRDFPPVLIQAGTRELLLSDSVRMHRALRAAGKVSRLELYEGMPHVLQPILADTLSDMNKQTTSVPPRRQRRPQAERTAETRAKLIEAAITCIHRTGYGQTTISTVALEAGLSRGAVTHQFPAKTDLMIAVLRAVYDQDSEHYHRSVAATSPLEWLRSLPTTMWEVISRPSAIAVMEIMLAARSDPDLAARLRETQQKIDIEAHQWVLERLQAAGIQDRPDGEAIHRLFVAAVRGLALESVFMQNRQEVEKSIAVLAETLRYLYPGLALP